MGDAWGCSETDLPAGPVHAADASDGAVAQQPNPARPQPTQQVLGGASRDGLQWAARGLATGWPPRRQLLDLPTMRP